LAQGTLPEPLNVGPSDMPGAVEVPDQEILRADDDRQPQDPIAEGQSEREHQQRDQYGWRSVGRRRDQSANTVPHQTHMKTIT
jgi:hypothetical protein